MATYAYLKGRQKFFSVNDSEPDMYYSLDARTEEEADSDKPCSESIAEDESVEEE